MPKYELNGIELNVEVHGQGSPLLMLHGFTGSTRAWHGVPERLATTHEAITIDIIGHGESVASADPARYRIEHAVEDIAALLEQLGHTRVTVLGYSMGGRVALHLALAHPDRINALILESTSPGIADDDERSARQKRDDDLAEMIEQQGLERFIDYWEAISLFQSQRSLPEAIRAKQRAIRLDQRPHGLANSLRGMGAGAMEPVQDRLHSLTMPVLFIAGEHDDKYREIGKQVVSSVPRGKYAEVPGAGHTVHLEQPEAYLRVVAEFLSGMKTTRYFETQSCT